MSVLIVTGAAGWLGQNLVADVREGAVQAAAQPLLAGIDALRVLARDAEEAAALRALAPTRSWSWATCATPAPARSSAKAPRAGS